MMRWTALLTLMLSLAVVTSCTSLEEPAGESTLFGEPVQVALGGDERAKWLRDQLIQDNRDLLERSPQLTRGKLRKMASSPYNYFRGTASVYWADMTQPGAYRARTAFGSSRASHMLLVGDPHPENIGTYRMVDGALLIAFNDFDGSTFGPAHLDVWRLALGFSVLGAALEPPLSEAERDMLARAVARGYDAAARNPDGARHTRQALAEDATASGVILADLARRAARDGAVRGELDAYAPLEGGQRVMFLGDREPYDARHELYQDTLEAPTDADRALVADLLARYATTLNMSPQTMRLKGLSVRLGAGVSSYPARRMYALLEGASESPEDDVLLELKEVFDPVQVPLVHAYGASRFAHNAERIVWAQRVLQGSDEADVWLGWAAASSGVLGVRVRHRTQAQRGVGLERIQSRWVSGEWGMADLLELAEQAGVMLAAAHGSSELVDGSPAREVLREALQQGDGAGFEEEVSGVVRRYSAQTLEDYERLRALIARHGDALGYRTQRGVVTP